MLSDCGRWKATDEEKGTLDALVLKYERLAVGMSYDGHLNALSFRDVVVNITSQHGNAKMETRGYHRAVQVMKR